MGLGHIVGLLLSIGVGSHVSLVTPQGQPAVSPWPQWAAEAKVPTPPLVVTIEPASWCDAPGLPPAVACSADGPAFWAVAASSRYSLYYELGHIFDARVLTWPERGILAHMWGVYGSPWEDSSDALVRGEEDGLAVDFAAAYAACAMGEHPQSLASGWAPAIRMAATCTFIRHF